MSSLYQAIVAAMDVEKFDENWDYREKAIINSINSVIDKF